MRLPTLRGATRAANPMAAAGRRVLQRCGRLLLRLNKSRQIIRPILHPRFGCTLGLPWLRTTADAGTAAANSQWYVNPIPNGCSQSSYFRQIRRFSGVYWKLKADQLGNG